MESRKGLKRPKANGFRNYQTFCGPINHTTKKDMNETPYSLAFGFKVVISLKVGLLTILTKAYNDNHNAEVLARDLNLADE